MKTACEPLDAHETRLLSYLLDRFGSRTKLKINHAWESGDYSCLGDISTNDEQILQQLRNSRGPSWLWGLKWKEVKANG